MIVPVGVILARSIWNPVFLALALWREARGSSIEAKVAVAHSIMNRVEKPSWWGKTLSEVLGKRWQYSSLAAPNDPQLLLWPRPEDGSFQECLSVARAVIGKTEDNPFPGADSYFDSSISAPKWAVASSFRGQVDSPHGNTLMFYDVDHDWEAPVTGHV